jgi:hypothetical protein
MVRAAKTPLAIVELAGRREITLQEVRLCEQIAGDIFPEKFLARIDKVHRAILTSALIHDMSLSRIRGNRDEAAVIAELRAALAHVMEVHA